MTLAGVQASVNKKAISLLTSSSVRIMSRCGVYACALDWSLLLFFAATRVQPDQRAIIKVPPLPLSR